MEIGSTTPAAQIAPWHGRAGAQRFQNAVALKAGHPATNQIELMFRWKFQWKAMGRAAVVVSIYFRYAKTNSS